MTFQKLSNLKRICAVLLGLVLLFGNIAIPAFAESNLTPDDNTFENGNIILHKQAERTAADEWKVHVKATIKDQPVEPPKLEVTFILDTSYSMRGCAEKELHDKYYSYHYHDFYGSCNLICSNTDSTHTHVDACYDCGTFEQVHSNTNSCTYWHDGDRANPINFTSRLDVAKQVMQKMESSLPEGTRIRRVAFNIKNFAEIFDSYDNIPLGMPTYMMDGVRLALSSDCFTDDPSTRKIMIIISDGEPSDEDFGANDPDFQAFRQNNIVYTVGFNYDNSNLESMTSGGGTYSYASNPDELETIFDHITYELTAMIVDPMGEEVDLKSGTTVQPDTSVSGDLTFDSSADTLYWNPTKSTDITNSSIEYTYTVKLGSGANMSAGVHTDVELNKNTYLYYGTSDNTIKEPAEFPQPIAEYAVSTLQVNWKAGSTDLRTPTETESVICDFGEPAFSTNYNDIPASITKDGVTYYYNSTEITKNGEKADAVTIADAAAFVVTHQYSEIATYQVTYEYTGEVPENAPSASANNLAGLNAGDTVQVAAAPSSDGYVFSGWTVVDGNATIEDGSFSMPEGNVKLQGHWSKLKGYRVLVNYYTSTNGGTYVKDNAESIEIAKNLQTTDTNVSVDFSSALFWNGHIYGSPALAEGSAAAEISGNFINKIAPSDPTAEVIVNLFRDVRTTATVTVRYVDSEGKKLQDDTTSGALYVGDDYDVSAAKNVASITVDGVIYDFVSDDNAAYTGTVPANGLEITRTYKEHSKAAVVVHYVDEAGNKLQDDTTSGEIYVGANFDVTDAENVTSITVDGVIYDFVGDNNAAYTGTVPANDLEITRTYKERSKATVVVHYVDEAGNKLKDDTSSGSIYVGNDFDITDAENVTSITVDGKIYDFVSDSNAEYTGTVPANGLEITRTYKERSKATVVVHYVDEAGNKLQDDTTSGEIYVGANFDVTDAENVTSITVDGVIYDFVSDSSAVYTGTVPANDLEITRTYKERSKAAVIVHYVDEAGNKLQDDTTTGEIYVGADFDVSEAKDVASITVDGVIYDFVGDNNAEYTGKVSENGLEITRTYKERSKATVVVHYVDEAGNKLKDDTTSGNIYVGADFDVSAAKDVASITVDGVIYDFVSDNNAAYTGKVPENGLEITRTYKERSKAAVIVHYVDEAGDKLKDDTTSGNIYVGADFDVSEAKDVASITVDGVTYDFVSDDNAAYIGKVPADGLEITRVYQKKEVPNESKPESTTPNTGDQYLFLLASVMLLSVCALIALTAKKWWKKVM